VPSANRQVSYSTSIGPDGAALPATSARPAWCPITRYLRGLGVDGVKSQIVDLRPTQAHYPVHIEQRSYLASAEDHRLTEMTVNARFSLNEDQSLTMSAEFLGESSELIACSESRIAFLDEQDLRDRRRLRKARAPESIGLPILFSCDDIRCYCAASGDDNPIHLDQAFSARLGLPSLAVPGALLLQTVEDCLHHQGLIDLTWRIEAQFVDIVYEGQQVLLSTRRRVSGTSKVVRFSLKKPDGQIALMGAAIKP
jgi:hypothetical protein